MLNTEQLGDAVRAALESADLTGLADLLDPDVRWGPPGDSVSGCHNRRQVIDWYELARRAGARATVSEVIPGDDKLLVGLRVTLPDARGRADEDDRWQVLTVRAGLIVDIRGYDNRPEAASAAGVQL